MIIKIEIENINSVETEYNINANSV